ncbi:MAG TPA: single-stranded-DNA-specific exonuclease RecJ [Dehalococcoidia bacterium]|nr:single-stranded-DNA-specific exonuclease RecJ [Dehalococcoidia bacterium]
MPHSRWQVLPPLTPGSIPQTAAGSPFLYQLLHNRGLTDPSQFSSFLAADEGLQNNPLLLPDMPWALRRLYQGLLRGESIAIYGDFDVDGIAATALLVEGLTSVGGKVIPYIPHRLSEGYGLTAAALEELRRKGISLVITVDCGITAHAEIRQARKLGLDVIITDHHSVPAELPPAMACVNPRRPDSGYPFPELTGVGVAFKLLQALHQALGRPEALSRFGDLIALGTVADMAPLLGENRFLVKHGLELLNHTQRPGLQELIRCSGLMPGRIDAEAISWILGPRLNAAGRLAHALLSYNLLVAESAEAGQRLAQELERYNAERQRLTDKVWTAAREQAMAQSGAKLILAADEDFPPGVVGIVAGKLVEEYYRPSLVVERGKKMSRGSARSIPEFDIVAALAECRRWLTRFGGHPLAAGFTLPTENLPRLHQRLLEMAETKLAGLDLRPQLFIDAEIPLSRLDGRMYQEIQQLAPFGYGNPVPTFLSRRVQVTSYHALGNQSSHLELRLREGNIAWRGVGFGLGDLRGEVSPYLDIVYNLGVDDWTGTLQLNILDFAPSVT